MLPLRTYAGSHPGPAILRVSLGLLPLVTLAQEIPLNLRKFSSHSSYLMPCNRLDENSSLLEKEKAPLLLEEKGGSG